METLTNRRTFLATSLATGIALSWPAFAKDKDEEDVSAVEDLMREHGALNRILLIYEESQRRLRDNGDFLPKALEEVASIIKNFIENYHEKLEEEFIFPRLEKNEKYAPLARTLREQHDAGRKITAEILSLSKSRPKSDARTKLDRNIAAFIRMYRPHESFEDTIAFPAFKKEMPRKEYDELGEKFEEREHQLFGSKGFEKILSQIDAIEERLGIHDLRSFTP